MNQNKLLMESLVGIFTAEQGKIKLLLIRKKSEPYKGYWVLPGEFLKIDESLEENVISDIYFAFVILSLQETIFLLSSIIIESLFL